MDDPADAHASCTKGYDNRRVHRYLAGGGITARITLRGIGSSTRLGRHRWVIERSIA